MSKKNKKKHNNNTKNISNNKNTTTNNIEEISEITSIDEASSIEDTKNKDTIKDTSEKTTENNITNKDTVDYDTENNLSSDEIDEQIDDIDDLKPHMSDFMGNGNDVFTTYKTKYENTMSSAIILLFFGVAGIISTIGILSGMIDLPLSTFQHIFLTSLYVMFLVYGIVSFFKALDYKEKISTENTMEDTIDRYLENHVTKEYLDTLHDDSITEEENYVLYITTIQENFINENPDFDKDLVEYHIDNFLNEHF